VATDDERDPVDETSPGDSTARDEVVEVTDELADDELDIEDPEALERATGRVSDAELGEDDELVDEPTDAELAELTEGLDATANAAAQNEAEADGNTRDDRELVGVGAPTRGSTARAKSSKQQAEKKGRATPKRDGGAAARKRTGPVTFVKESVGELRKVVYPTGPQLANYFVVVLIFVLFVIAFVSVLDLAFGWAILKIFS
jgi:preprotein translocase subunit SecE